MSLNKVLKLKNESDGDSYHIKTSSLICSANQWAGFYMTGTSVMKELRPIISYNDSHLETKWKNPTTIVHLPCPSCHSYKTIWQLLDNFIMINRYPSRNISNLPSENSCREQLTSKQSFYLLTIFIKGSVKHVWHSSQLYASAYAGHLLWSFTLKFSFKILRGRSNLLNDFNISQSLTLYEIVGHMQSHS